MNKFVRFSHTVERIRVENLLHLAKNEQAENLYEQVKIARVEQLHGYNESEAVKKMAMKLTIKGIFKYGLVLCISEISTVGSIFMFKLMIDFLQNPDENSQEYAIGIFAAFCILRLVTLFSRSWYDLHVYNYFRFVQTQIQCWLFELVCGLKQW